MHFHGYEYQGPGEPATRAFDPARRLGTPGFESSTVPPELVSAWLAKPARLVAGTWKDPADAVEWLRERHQGVAGSLMNPGLNTEAPSVDTLAASALADLSGGNDAVWAWWLRGGSFASFSVVCCPSKFTQVRCPAGYANAKAASATV